MADTQQKAAPQGQKPLLSDAEAKQLEKLLAKANAANQHGPAVRIGDAYVALTNLSVPRRGILAPGEVRQSDLVQAGETVYLTPEEAAPYLRHGDRDGRRIPVIARKGEVDANNPPRPHPSYLSGPVFRPVTPPPGSDLPRPDPAGSSRLAMLDSPVPEAAPPVPGSENAPPSQDAVDILPGGQLARDRVQQGADRDVVEAYKAQAGLGIQERR